MRKPDDQVITAEDEMVSATCLGSMIRVPEMGLNNNYKKRLNMLLL